MTESKVVKVKIKPLTVNQCWQGRRFKTPAYKAYEKELLYTLPEIEIPEDPFRILLEFGFSTRNSDLDNPVKGIMDILQKRYDFNDRYVYEMFLRKKIVKKGDEYIIFKIEHLELE